MALLFPKPGKKKKEGQSTREKAHLDLIRSTPCVVCRMMGFVNHRRSDPHHVKEGQGMACKASDYETIPLCPRHHTIGQKGEAYHADPGSWPFDQRELLEVTWKLLRVGGFIPMSAPLGEPYVPLTPRMISSFVPAL